MSQHGKWKVGPVTVNGNHHIFAFDTDTGATVVAFEVLPHHARLIAAAPQMAEALRQLVDAIEDYIDDGSLPRDAESHETMRNARAALAKAGGK